MVQRIQRGYLQLYKKKFSQRQEPSYSFSPCPESSGEEVFNHLYKTTPQGWALGPCIWTSFQSHFWSAIQVSCILSAQFAYKWCLVNIILQACLTLSTSLLSSLSRCQVVGCVSITESKRLQQAWPHISRGLSCSPGKAKFTKAGRLPVLSGTLGHIQFRTHLWQPRKMLSVFLDGTAHGQQGGQQVDVEAQGLCCVL